MNHIRPIIHSIRSLLESSMPNSAAASTAEAYARHCAEAEQRLAMAAAMLDKGSDYQALQVAEQDPPLLDLVGALSFGGEKAWQNFCEAHQLTVAPRLNARTVQALDALYARGITASHPLYKDFRSAVLARDDDKCLHILRTILKLNPSDENARKELQRLDHKRFQHELGRLRESLKAGDEELIAGLIEKLNTMAPAEKLQRSEPYVTGAAIRRRLRRIQTEQRIPGMVRHMLEQHADGDWRNVGMDLASLQSLLKEHGIEISDASIAQNVNTLRQFHERESRADQKRREFQSVLSGLMAQMDEVGTRLNAGSRPGCEELSDWEESVARQWHHLQEYQMPVPEETLSRLQSGRQALRSRLNHMRRVRQAQTFAKAAAVTGLLTCTTATGLHGWKAWSVSQELAALQTKQVCRPAEELIRNLQTDHEWLTRWPWLEARLMEVDSWTRRMRAVEHQAHEAVQSLESSFDGESSRLSPGLLVKQLGEAGSLVESLPDELAGEPRIRLASLRDRVDLQLGRMSKELAASTDAALTAIEQESTKSLSFEQSSSKTAEVVKQIAVRLAPLEAALHPDAEALRLPDTLESRIVALRDRLNDFEGELKKLNEARARTAAADSLAGYKAALAGWKEIRFVETASAAAAIEAAPSDQALLARLLTDGDESALKAVMADSTGTHMMAAAPTADDLKILHSLQNDEFLNDVWENRVADYSHGGVETTLWSCGTLTRARIGENFRWTGRYYDPAQPSPAVSFIKRDLVRVQAGSGHLGTGVTASRLSPTSAFVNSLQLNRITDEDGGRYMQSLLTVFDKLVQDCEASPVAKAYLMGRFESMLMHQAHAWGLHLCPSLRADLNELHQLLGEMSLRSEDWLVPSKLGRLTGPLSAFFRRCEGRSYLSEATSRRTILRDAALAGVRFAGYVDLDSTLVLTQSGRTASELWALAKNGGKPKMILKPEREGAGEVVSAEVLPLSPVFFISSLRGNLLPGLEGGLSVTGPEKNTRSIETAALTPP